MKRKITSLFSAKNLALALFFAAPMVATGQVIFSQSFGTNATPISTYHSLTPTTNQFDFIGTTGTSSVYIANNTDRLVLQRTGGVAAFTRITDLPVVGNVLKIKFKLLIGFSTPSTGNTATFTVGGGFAASATGEVVANQHSRITFVVPTASGTFQLRSTQTTPMGNSPEYTGQQEITWFINNSDATISYTDPAGGMTSLDNDVADVWVGTTRVLTNAAVTATQPITDFKFLLNNGSSAFGFDDIEISTGSNVVIPVTLSSFKAKKMEAANQLTWTTETEINNKGYDVQRQTANGTWETLGFVKGTGLPSTYSFEDKTPLSISYYRLLQMDFDGKETLSKVVSVAQNQKGQVRVSPNPASDKVNIILSNNDGFEATIITVYDLLGKQVLTQKTTANTVELDMSSLAKGVYLLKINANNSIYTEKITRQ